jgi:hypothetical protein
MKLVNFPRRKGSLVPGTKSKYWPQFNEAFFHMMETGQTATAIAPSAKGNRVGLLAHPLEFRSQWVH